MEYEFRFPDVGEGIQEGTILEWKIQTGGKVSEGQIIVVVETDKVVAELPSPRDGTLLRQGAEKGQVVRVGQVLAVIGQEQLVPEQEILQDSASVVGRLSDRPAEVLPFTGEGLPGYIDARTVSPEPSIISSPKVRATPVARRLASNFKINLDRVKGTGPGGRIMKEDILKTSGSNGGSAGKDEPPGGVPPTGIETDRDPASSPFGRRGLTALRRTIAANMTQSQQVPAAAVHDYVPIDELVKIRSSLNRESETERLGFMAFFVKLTAFALREFRLLNATFHPEREGEEIEVHESINIGVAVDSENGLMVPLIHDADALSVRQIQARILDLAEKTR